MSAVSVSLHLLQEADATDKMDNYEVHEEEYPEVAQLDEPPDGLVCTDRCRNEVHVGDRVRVLATGSVVEVKHVVYIGFEDRELAKTFSEPGFMVSPMDNGCDLVHAADCEVARDKMDNSEMQRYMSDAVSMFEQYKETRGTSNFDAYKDHLELFFLHTLNSHVFGMGPEDYDGAKVDKNGFALHESRAAAEDALMKAANIDHAEVGRIFHSVDAVHAYS